MWTGVEQGKVGELTAVGHGLQAHTASPSHLTPTRTVRARTHQEAAFFTTWQWEQETTPVGQTPRPPPMGRFCREGYPVLVLQ